MQVSERMDVSTGLNQSTVKSNGEYQHERHSLNSNLYNSGFRNYNTQCTSITTTQGIDQMNSKAIRWYNTNRKLDHNERRMNDEKVLRSSFRRKQNARFARSAQARNAWTMTYGHITLHIVQHGASHGNKSTTTAWKDRQTINNIAKDPTITKDTLYWDSMTYKTC